MIIAFLIAIIGIIPIVLAISALKLYKGSELAIPLLLYMVSISFWQLDIAVLYLQDTFSEELILWLFKLFRAGPTFLVPLVYYLSYIIIKKHSAFSKSKIVNRVLFSIYNKYVLVCLLIWSTMIYVINLTELGISGLQVIKVAGSNTSIYFPEYGPLQFLYIIHIVSFILFFAVSYLISKGFQNQFFREFIATFFFCSFFLFITGLLNFIPGSGALFSSLGIIIFSVIIIFSFVKMNTVMTVNYNRLLERQKKLDYTGNLTGSLVHEVKNSLVIIKGYSKLLSELTALPSQGKKMNEMIQTAAEQIDNLTVNYTKYIEHKSIEYKLTDLNETIDRAIKLTAELTSEHAIDVYFERKFKTLKVYLNETNMKQVFINLIKNSTEAIPPERTNRNITIKTNIDADKIVIDVIDTGKGIQFECWEAIFDPFISYKEGGSGLGLPYVKKVIFEHRGEINVIESSPEGTHFQITLPQFAFSDF
ncbi:sensor histidine kinase [Metabacillus sp. Hm71]|uniref:sensor histidine kinase n=1 Tax=Metabacillus sp. Hm71 TaxID=3450743 RepID=UPI003F427256